jgi:hypothetical protein
MKLFIKDITRPIFISNVISINEEKLLVAYLNKLLSRRKYEGDHWDDVIQHYKEIEVTKFPPELDSILSRVKQRIGDSIRRNCEMLPRTGDPVNPRLHGQLNYLPVHVIDLAATGHIGIDLISLL